MEFALSPSSLSIVANVKVIEGNSSTGYTGVGLGGAATPAETNRLIQRDQPFSVNVDWTENGIFVPFLGGGTWKIDVLFERMGGAETNFNPGTTVTTSGKIGKTYTASINVLQGTLPAGLYRLICRMQWHFAGGTPGPIVMFDDLGLIQIYQEL
jgi:hypothetical protein